MNDKEAERLTGCLLMVWSLLVTIPLWLVFLFGVLHTINAPPWMWVLYWVYMPAHVLGGVLAGLVRIMMD